MLAFGDFTALQNHILKPRKAWKGAQHPLLFKNVTLAEIAER